MTTLKGFDALRSLIVLAVALLATPPITGAEISGPAPDFILPARSGGQVALSELKGQVVMLNFWAT